MVFGGDHQGDAMPDEVGLAATPSLGDEDQGGALVCMQPE